MFSLIIFSFLMHAEVEFTPYAPGSHEALEAFDRAYREETGEDTGGIPEESLLRKVGGCSRLDCALFANVVRSEQKIYLYANGKYLTSWKISSARAPYTTPDYDGNPTGPFYSGAFTSKKYPGGDYMGLGNMPYAVFYNGHYAIHGTPAIAQLGKPASHGCVRTHPSSAEVFSRLVRHLGADGVWVTVSQLRVVR